MNIELNFVNRSNDQNNSAIFLFQKNAATQQDQLATAWKVIRNCGYNCSHPFVYSRELEASISDQYGNYSPRRLVRAGELYSVAQLPGGRRFSHSGKNNSSKDISIRNDLPRGAVNVCLYNNGKLLAKKINVAPEQKALFQFIPTLWIGTAAQVVEGETIDSAILDDVHTELSLLGIASADIVMTGGGMDRDCRPLSFSLENIALA